MARTRYDVSCRERLEYCRRLGIDFMARESELPMVDGKPAICSGTFTSILLVREPLERLVSHLGEIFSKRHQASGYGKLLPPAEMLQPGGRQYDMSRILRSPFALLADNYLTRYLSGVPVAKLPFGAMKARTVRIIP